MAVPMTTLPLRVPDEAPSSGDHAQDRLALVLEVARASSSLDLPQLIARVGKCLLGGHWRWDNTGLCLYEPAHNALRVHSFFVGPGPLSDVDRRLEVGALIPVEGSQSGRAFLTGTASVANTRAEYLATMSPDWAARLPLNAIPPEYSSCVVPLVCRGRRIGTLAVCSVRDGAFDAEAVQLMSEIAETLAPAVDNALAYREIEDLKDRLAKEKRYLESEVDASFEDVVGHSPALKKVLALVASVARTDSMVLIQGETGTGKELVARAIHRLGERRDGTFVKLNCAAIPTGLLESELFGHEKGAFTGAVSQKAGRFELAHRGTLFLDEVGEIPLDLQPKLLRVLQDQEFERLGGTRTLKVDARVVAATNRNLAEMVGKGSFRSDLFYRLNVFPISLPPLRDRPEDIPALASHFVERTARRLRKTITDIPAESMRALCRYHWPGNVRELANVIERGVILSPGPELRISGVDLEATESGHSAPAAVRSGVPEVTDQPRRLVDMERAFILKTLQETHWVVGGVEGAAARLGLSRTTLQGRMRKLGISRPG
jgi:formate hydrogenlyase transcriptional activator